MAPAAQNGVKAECRGQLQPAKPCPARRSRATFCLFILARAGPAAAKPTTRALDPHSPLSSPSSARCSRAVSQSSLLARSRSFPQKVRIGSMGEGDRPEANARASNNPATLSNLSTPDVLWVCAGAEVLSRDGRSLARGLREAPRGARFRYRVGRRREVLGSCGVCLVSCGVPRVGTVEVRFPPPAASRDAGRGVAGAGSRDREPGALQLGPVCPSRQAPCSSPPSSTGVASRAGYGSGSTGGRGSCLSKRSGT